MDVDDMPVGDDIKSVTVLKISIIFTSSPF